MREGHISRAFDGDLAALHLRALEMGGLVLEQVREAARAYSEWDAGAAARVIERSASIAEYESSIGRDELTLIARRQPVSGDLRAIFALAKCAAELESAADEVRKIARTVLRRTGRPAPQTCADVRHLASLAITLLRDALDALDRIDGNAAARVTARDEELDAEYAAGLRRLITRAMEEPRQLEVAIEAAFALKSLERVGDHARILADRVRDIVEDEPAPAPALADLALRMPHVP